MKERGRVTPLCTGRLSPACHTSMSQSLCYRWPVEVGGDGRKGGVRSPLRDHAYRYHSRSTLEPPDTWGSLCETVMVVCRYSLLLVNPLASTLSSTHGLHSQLPTSSGGGALHHYNVGLEGDLVVLKGRVGVELDRATWRQYRHAQKHCCD